MDVKLFILLLIKEIPIHNFKGGTPMCGMTSNQ